jgi:hypothetical protein
MEHRTCAEVALSRREQIRTIAENRILIHRQSAPRSADEPALAPTGAGDLS